MEGYGFILDPMHIEIGIARGDLAEVDRKLKAWKVGGLDDIDGRIARLNALVALERRAEIEQEAPTMLKPATYLEPFALRALGFARGDDALIEHAIERFEAMGLDWYAADTRKRLARSAAVSRLVEATTGWIVDGPMVPMLRRRLARSR